jgi:hypothetical protein
MERMEQISVNIYDDLGLLMSPLYISKNIYIQNKDIEIIKKFKLIGNLYTQEGLTLGTPFVKSAIEGCWNKESFIIADYLYPSGESKGMTSQQILTCPFAYLTHASHLEHVEDIMNDGFLKPVYRLDEDTHYPGLYCYPNLHNPEDAYKNMGLEVIYILSLSLFRKRAWHINRDENYGNISSNTYDYVTFPEYLRSYYSELNPHKFGEIIFHEKVPLEYIEAVIVQDANVLRQMNKLLFKRRIPAYTVDEWKKLPLVKMIRGLSSGGSYTNDPPNFCYDNMGGDDIRVLPIKNIKYTLLNSGFSRQEANKIVAMKRNDLLVYMKDLWVSRLETGEKYPPVIHPPY